MHYYNHVQLENNRNDQQFNVNDLRDAPSICRKYKGYHVMAHMQDGSMIEGIIDDMDDEGVTMLIPEELNGDTERQFGFDGGYGRRRFRRFRRRRFPFYFFLFPFFSPYPYYYPY
ncbi:hypothetical protein [Bacillus sp. FSL K6-3431]|uniref:hypothetical protein n=1 Tax=Bacillus sp. FSL K6-3431 TaxID=2921500 RepID=UPI0030FBFD10